MLGYIYVAPALATALAVILFPLAYNAYLSLNVLNLQTGQMRPVGLENFEIVFASSHFIEVVRQTLVWAAGSVALQLLSGLAVALMLQGVTRGRGLLGAIILIPWVSSYVVSAAIWRWLLHPELGALAQPVRAVGLGLLIDNWRSDPALAMAVMILINTWKWFPFVAVMMLAALQTIKAELYESAELDGANYAQRFWYITLPGLQLALLSTAILTTTWALNGFTLVWLITGGAPAGATDLMTILIYRLGFANLRFGQAAAGSVVLFGMVLCVTLFYVRFFGRERTA
jgi:multiple sugar transport system permease protein